jgi:tRNA (guanine-N7-)-methyltransferase
MNSSARFDLPERRRGQLYGRRKGPKLSAHQSGLLETLLPQLTLNIEQGRDPRAYFDSVDDVWLEVGFGGGEHLHWQAEQNPRIGMIGAEPFVNGVAKLLTKIENGPRNIRIHMGDARDIIDALPDASLARVFILFPDPWPKTRHHKRRFVQMEMLDSLARVMKPQSELRFATDDAPYLEWALERFTAHPSFEWLATRASGWKSRTEDWPQTRYEAKQLHGVPSFLRFRRV